MTEPPEMLSPLEVEIEPSDATTEVEPSDSTVELD